MIFETHAHYDDEQFTPDRGALLAALPEKGIGKIINVGASVATTRMTLALAEQYRHIYAAVGVHPGEIRDLDEDNFLWLKQQTTQGKVVAIGEIGLDYYWEKDPVVQETQRHWFRRQMALAKDADLPVIIHSRDAAADTMQIVSEAGNWSPSSDGCGVIHCYSYSAEQALQYIKLGYYIGVGGVVTFKNAKKLKETVQAIPLSRILLETDCPYMAPEPYRGKRNESSYLTYVAEKIAEIKEISPAEVEKATWENAIRLFSRAAS